jgi:hypothetical protein
MFSAVRLGIEVDTTQVSAAIFRSVACLAFWTLGVAGLSCRESHGVDDGLDAQPIKISSPFAVADEGGTVLKQAQAQVVKTTAVTTAC